MARVCPGIETNREPVFIETADRARGFPLCRTNRTFAEIAEVPVSPGSGMLRNDREVIWVREHRPLSRGSRTAPQPYQGRPFGRAPGPHGAVRARQIYSYTESLAKLPRRYGLHRHWRRRLHRIESR